MKVFEGRPLTKLSSFFFFSFTEDIKNMMPVLSSVKSLTKFPLSLPETKLKTKLNSICSTKTKNILSAVAEDVLDTVAVGRRAESPNTHM